MLDYSGAISKIHRALFDRAGVFSKIFEALPDHEETLP
jgi:hypothetical protein